MKGFFFDKMLAPTKGGGNPWPSYWTQRSLFFLDGTILDVAGTKYFVDKSANGRNFLITNYDFATAWVSGFPYKSAATISAPAADAALIAADINNFLYAADGTPNEINVNQLFQNIDYLNTIFCKHTAQTVDGNGVEVTEANVSAVFMTAAALSAEDLVKAYTDFGVTAEAANAAWVLATGNDTTGNGTKATPYLTLDKADGVVNTATIPIYVGTKNDYAGDVSLVYLYDPAAHTIKGIGRAVVRTAAAAYTHRLRYDTKASLAGLTYIPSGNLTAQAVYQQTCPSIELDKLFINSTAAGAVGPQFKSIKNSVILGTYSDFPISLNAPATGNIEISSCFINATSPGVCNPPNWTGIISFLNNKIRGTYTGGSGFVFRGLNTAAQFLIKGNDIDVAASVIFSNSVDIVASEISYNTFYLRSTLASRAIANSTSYNTLTVNRNRFIDVANYGAGEVYLIVFTNAKGVISNNLIKLDNTQKTAGGAEIQFLRTNTTVIDTVVVSGNRLLSNRTIGYHICIGGESTTANDDTITLPVIEKNYIRSSSYYDETYVGKTVHSSFIGHQLNGHIRWNNFSEGGYGAIIKHTGDTQVSGGVYGNLLINQLVYGALAKGVDGVVIANNTVIYSACTPAGGAIGLIANTAGTDSDNCVVKNNILVYTGEGNFTAVLIEGGAANVVDYNIYYCTGTLRFSVGGAFKTFAEWQALGYDEHSVVLTEAQFNALFANFAGGDYSLPVGSAAIGAGETLDAAYDDGLDASTDWGGDTEVPTVVTKQQGAAWDCGAYVS